MKPPMPRLVDMAGHGLMPWIVVSVALAAGVTAAFASSGLWEPVPAPQARAAPEMIPANEVLVATAPLPLGKRLGAADLKWLRWPDDALVEGMILKRDAPDAIARNSGSMVRESFVANEPIRKERLLEADEKFLAASLPGGKRALAISVDQRFANGAGMPVLPNDHVDVIRVDKEAGAAKARGNDIYLTDTLLSNIRVLAIGPIVDTAGRAGEPETATLELEPDQVMMVALAQHMGTLMLAHRDVVGAPAPEPVRHPETTKVTIVRGKIRQEYVVAHESKRDLPVQTVLRNLSMH